MKVTPRDRCKGKNMCKYGKPQPTLISMKRFNQSTVTLNVSQQFRMKFINFNNKTVINRELIKKSPISVSYFHIVTMQTPKLIISAENTDTWTCFQVCPVTTDIIFAPIDYSDVKTACCKVRLPSFTHAALVFLCKTRQFRPSILYFFPAKTCYLMSHDFSLWMIWRNELSSWM